MNWTEYSIPDWLRTRRWNRERVWKTEFWRIFVRSRQGLLVVARGGNGVWLARLPSW